jgi:hypothetical protein
MILFLVIAYLALAISIMRTPEAAQLTPEQTDLLPWQKRRSVSPERELPTFPPVAQSELFDAVSENDPAQIKRYWALSSPPLPQAPRAVFVRIGPQRGPDPD